MITQAGDDQKVKALVYVAAFAPDVGQSINDILKGYPAPPWVSELRKDTAGYLTLSNKAISEDFAQDVSRAKISDVDVQTLYAHFMHDVTPASQANRINAIPWSNNMRWRLAIRARANLALWWAIRLL